MGQTVSLNIHQNDTLTDVNLGSVYLLANNKILLSEKIYHTYHMDNSYYECTFYYYYWECNCASSNYTFSQISLLSTRNIHLVKTSVQIIIFSIPLSVNAKCGCIDDYILFMYKQRTSLIFSSRLTDKSY